MVTFLRLRIGIPIEYVFCKTRIKKSVNFAKNYHSFPFFFNLKTLGTTLGGEAWDDLYFTECADFAFSSNEVVALDEVLIGQQIVKVVDH